MNSELKRFKRRENSTKLIAFIIGFGIFINLIWLVPKLSEETLETLRSDDVIETGIVTDVVTEDGLFTTRYIITIETETDTYVETLTDETKVLYKVGKEVKITRNDGEKDILDMTLVE